MNSNPQTSKPSKMIALALGATLCLSVKIQAYASAGSEGASFLDIPVGAAPAALGSAYTALATNAYAPVWNPAGLGLLSGNEVAGQHLAYLESIHYEYLSFVHPLDRGRNTEITRGVGFSVQYLGTGNMEATDVDSGNNPIARGSYSSYYASYNLAYGQTINEKLALGVTGKMIRAKIDDVSASAYAADLGGLFRVNDKVQLGASLVNVGSKLKFLSEGDSLPMAFKVGGAYQPNSHWLGSTEVVYRKSGPASFHVGGQWRPIETISLRLGYKTDTLEALSPLAGLTVGLGLHVWGQELAYAWAPYGDLGDAQYISMLIRFGAPEEAKRNLIRYQNIKQHRTVRSGSQDDLEPEYQQLMQLLGSSDESSVAKSPRSGSSLDRLFNEN